MKHMILLKSFCFIVLTISIFCLASFCIQTNQQQKQVVDKNDPELLYDMSNAFDKTNVVDVLIIGSGPAGSTAAVYAKRGGFNVVVLEGYEPGGLLTKTTEVENWPGNTTIMGPDLVDNMRNHAMHFGAKYVFDSVVSVDTTVYPFIVQTDFDQTFHSFSLIIATGATPKKLEIEGEEEYWGRGVTTCAICDAPLYKDKDVIVVGGGDSAAEEAMQLSSYARSITIMVRKDKMRAAQSMQERLKNYKNIAIRYHVEVIAIKGDDDTVTHIDVLYNQMDKVVTEEINGVFLAIGHTPNTTFLNGQVALSEHGHIVLQEERSQKTSVPGIFAAGDVEDPTYRQAIISAGSGSKAALDAENFLRTHGYGDKVVEQLKNCRYMGKKQIIIEDELCESVIEISTIKEFEQYTHDQSGLVLIDFYAETCPSCMQMLPAYKSLAQQFPDVTFLKVDTDEAEDALLDKLHVNSIPCVLSLYNGDLAARYNQAMNEKELKKRCISLFQ
jgi:thioredoxin reductase (NADPH)